MNKQLNNEPLLVMLDRGHAEADRRQAGRPVAALAANHLIGVEIELEEFDGHAAAVAGVWAAHGDGSLVDGNEFVLYPPRSGDKLVAAINQFFDAGFRYSGGERTSVHIHVDMTDGVKVGQFRSLFAMAFMFEGAIYRVADEHRKWGGYSSPLIDMAPQRMNRILAATTAPQFNAGIGGADHEDRYYGFNCVALKKHGTLEFRYFPCTDDRNILLGWVNLVLELKSAAMRYPDPEELLKLFVNEAAVAAWVRENLPKSADNLLQYMDTVDAINRVKLIRAIMNDKNAVAEPPRAPKVSKSLKKLAIKRGWASEDNGPEAAPLPPPVAIEDVIGPDGQINMVRYQQLLDNVRARNAARR